MDKFVLFLGLLILFLSCKEKKVYPTQAIYLSHPPGYSLENSEYLGCPLGQGYYINEKGDSILALLFVKPDLTELRLEAMPFASINIEDENAKRSIVIAYPNDNAVRSISLLNYEDFVIRNHNTKLLIDQYLSNYKGENRIRIISWEGTEKTQNMVAEFFEENSK